MRQPIVMTLCLTGILGLTACENSSDETVERAILDVNVIDESDLNDVMLTVSDPNESVVYFKRAAKANPERIDLQRGLAISLSRAKRNTEAVPAWTTVTKMEGATPDDSIMLATSLIRTGKWKQAESVLDKIPPTFETFERYRLEAMVADANKEWSKADVYYDTAIGLTTRPANVLNNWGYSKLTRGDYAEAERLFTEAIQQDNSLFTAKNNLVLARGAQQRYTLPVIPMDQTERAQLLYTMALSAIKQGDVNTGENLLREAVETHPQHFDEATQALRALESA